MCSEQADIQRNFMPDCPAPSDLNQHNLNSVTPATSVQVALFWCTHSLLSLSAKTQALTKEDANVTVLVLKISLIKTLLYWSRISVNNKINNEFSHFYSTVLPCNPSHYPAHCSVQSCILYISESMLIVLRLSLHFSLEVQWFLFNETRCM